jgi:hypothetical protein
MRAEGSYSAYLSNVLSRWRQLWLRLPRPMVICLPEHSFTKEMEDEMANIEIAGMMKALRTERAHTRKELAKLDKVISALRELTSTNSTAARNGRRRTLSAAARRKIAKAQRARWAKVRQQRARKG